MTGPDSVLSLILIAFVVAWPVFFLLIGRHTKATRSWAGWRHLAFFFGPIAGLLIYVCLKVFDRAERSPAINDPH